ncbi:MAG: DNA repair protein RecN, partial [Myxococcota bacterium]
IEGYTHVRSFLEEAGLPCESELFLRRTVSRSGRSRAHVNDRPVTISFLRALGQMLVEISGQHAQTQLLQPRRHLDFLDTFGGLFPLREQVTACYREVEAEREELSRLGGDAHTRALREDYLLYQLEELSQAPLDQDEEALQEEQQRLAQMEEMIDAAREGELILSGAVLEQLSALSSQWGAWARLEPAFEEVCQSLDQAYASLDDARRTVRRFSATASNDPQRRREIEEIFSMLEDLKRKHRVHSLCELNQQKQDYEEEVQMLHAQEERLKKLESSCVQSEKRLFELASKLREKRILAAKDLERQVEQELSTVGMNKAHFVVCFSESFQHAVVEENNNPFETQKSLSLGMGPTGVDRVQFLLSSNPGEPPRPLQKTASGGELSRILLALKQILTEREPVSTCVFDEVDTGIGGRTATMLGRKIKQIAQQRQVLCITHLPQVACFGDRHFLIRKQEEEGRTRSQIVRLDEQEREQEMVRMLGTEEGSLETMAHARRLLEKAEQFVDEREQSLPVERR